VLRDALARRRRGELTGPFRGVRCSVVRDDLRYAREHPGAPVMRYECIAYTLHVDTTPPQTIGQPYIARVDFPRHAYTYCEFTPVGGEGAHTALTFAVSPSPACVGR